MPRLLCRTSTDQDDLGDRHEAPFPILLGVQDPLCGTHNREGNDEEHIFSKCAFSMSHSRGDRALSSPDLPKPSGEPYLMWQSQWSHSLFLNGCFIFTYFFFFLRQGFSV
ncbi:mCG147936 [Mus musculus]|nr:mCG147936 [Mus musculus]